MRAQLGWIIYRRPCREQTYAAQSRRSRFQAALSQRKVGKKSISGSRTQTLSRSSVQRGPGAKVTFFVFFRCRTNCPKSKSCDFTRVRSRPPPSLIFSSSPRVPPLPNQLQRTAAASTAGFTGCYPCRSCAALLCVCV